MIRALYSEDPGFPATDQAPGAVRYKVGAYVVDAVGGQPSDADVQAMLRLPDPAPTIEERLAQLEKIVSKLTA